MTFDVSRLERVEQIVRREMFCEIRLDVQRVSRERKGWRYAVFIKRKLLEKRRENGMLK